MRRPRRPASSRTAEPPVDSPHLAAIRLLSRRDLTAAELATRLLGKGYAQEDVSEEVDRLVAEGTINDHRTATAYAVTAARIKGRGRLRIRRELEARGVSAVVVDAVLTETLRTDDEMEAIRRFLVRRGVTERSLPADRRRVFQQLLRRGYSSAAISKALRIRNDADE